MGKIDKQCRCGKASFIFLAYAKRHLCERHFLEMFEKRLKKTVRERRMIRKGDKVAVSLSGGKDSSVLLHCLSRLRKDLPMELVAITVDEGIKGYRSNTIDNAKNECEKAGVEHVVFSYEEKIGMTMDRLMEKSPQETPCSYCGIIRRYFINKKAREMGVDKLAIGHNLDDTAQTILMNIFRNEPSRLARLGEPLVKKETLVQRIKPLMRSPENEVVAYAKLKGINVLEKSCPYQRFAFRKRIRGMVDGLEEEYPGTKFKILNSFLEMEDALRKKYSEGAAIGECSECGEPCSKELCKFCSLIKPILKH